MVEVKTAFCGIMGHSRKRTTGTKTFRELCNDLLLIGNQGGCQLHRCAVEKRESEPR